MQRLSASEAEPFDVHFSYNTNLSPAVDCSGIKSKQSYAHALCIQVAPASAEQKSSFLIKKGLTPPEIDEAFRRAPDAPAAPAPAPAQPVASGSPFAPPSQPGQQQVRLHCSRMRAQLQRLLSSITCPLLGFAYHMRCHGPHGRRRGKKLRIRMQAYLPAQQVYAQPQQQPVGSQYQQQPQYAPQQQGVMMQIPAQQLQAAPGPRWTSVKSCCCFMCHSDRVLQGKHIDEADASTAGCWTADIVTERHENA